MEGFPDILPYFTVEQFFLCLFQKATSLFVYISISLCLYGLYDVNGGPA